MYRKTALALAIPAALFITAGLALPMQAHAGSLAKPATTTVVNGHKVLRATLKNGLQVVIVRNTFTPVASTQVTYFAGGAQAPKGFPGIAHAQEHMMFRGSPGLSKDQLAAIMARLGGVMNATTSDDRTNYLFSVPKDDVDVALHIGALRMAGVNDFESQWKKERGAIEQEVARDHSSPLYSVMNKARKILFAGTPYVHDALGTKPSFDKLTGAQLKTFHDTWYAPNNALLVVTGDVDPQAVLAKVRKLYGHIPAGTIPAKAKFSAAPVKSATFKTNSDLPFGVVAVAFRMPGYDSPNYPAAELAAQALASKRGPLQALTFEGKVLGAGFQFAPNSGAGVGYAVAVYPASDNAEKVRKELIGAINQARKSGISNDIIAAVKRRAELKQQLQRNSEAIFGGLTGAWSHAIAVAHLNSPAEAFERLKAVTPSQVNAELRRSVNPDKAITIIATPTPGAKPKVGAGAGGHEHFSTKSSGPVTLPAWAKKAFATLPHPEPTLHPSDTHLANGIRLIVQPLHNSHSVSLYGLVHQNPNLQEPKGEQGVSDLLGSLFAYGPKGMTRQQFDAAQGRIGAIMSVGNNFSLKVLPEHFADGVKLLADDVLHPTLPKKPFKRRQFLEARAVAGRLKSPKFKFQRAVSKAIYPKGDPALRMATPKSIASLTLKDVKNYYRKVYRPDETTIVVIGDITPEKAKSVVTKYFGSWKANGPKPNLDLAAVPLSKGSRVFVPDSSKKQDKVVLAETLGLNQTNPAHYALNLANDYLSGGFYAAPLVRVVREKLGLVYTIGARFNFDRNRSTFKLNYGSYPHKVGEAKAAALKVLNNAIAKPFTADELHLAKSLGLRQVELSQRTVGAIARQWLNYSAHELPLDQAYVVARHYEKLTAPQIQKALKQYLEPSRLSTIIIGQPTR